MAQSALLRAAFALLAVSLACHSPAQAGDQGGPYDDFDALLKRYVNAEGLVDYAAWKKKDHKALKAVIARLEQAPADTFKGAVKKAYWINVYNAVTIEAILAKYPVASIKDLNKGGYDVWKAGVFGKKKLSLNDVEHKILRPMGDPRIHAAIVCASKGCPPLRPEAYVPSRLDRQLDDNCRVWFKSDVRGIKFKGGTAELSKIFEWFPKDFGDGSRAAHIKWISKFLSKDAAARLAKSKIASLDWEWALNAQ